MSKRSEPAWLRKTIPWSTVIRLIEKEEVTDRSDSSYQEATHLMRITMMVGRSMYDVLDFGA